MTREIIIKVLVDYVLASHPSAYTAETLPTDSSLVEAQVIDSYGIVEMIAFIEGTWGLTVEDDEITRENIGSIEKMAALVIRKLGSPT